MHSLSAISENMIVKHILPKTILWLHVVIDSMCLTSTTWCSWPSEAAQFGETMQNSNQHAVQGDSRSQTVVPMKSMYATSYAW